LACAAKRTFDIAVASCLLLCLAPTMVLVALLIKFDSRGPVFFRQWRTGKDGVPFSIFKFRTMVQHETPAHALDFVRTGDPRITRVGRLLRNTSIDELPQVFNVLKGEMAMVGPRPQPLCHIDHFAPVIPEYTRRLSAKPGITGLVQVSDMRSLVDSIEDHRRRVLMDLEYIDGWSIWLDVAICIRTACTMLQRYEAHTREFPDDAPIVTSSCVPVPPSDSK
jgi:undecaprenyl-phosphate galactose phosphotransferase/putative colanic acid biosynthesis UDP-glucose lipid carrier transferase